MCQVMFGLWMVLFSATMLVGLVFPMQGVLLGILGIAVGVASAIDGIVSRLAKQDRTDHFYVPVSERKIPKGGSGTSPCIPDVDELNRLLEQCRDEPEEEFSWSSKYILKSKKNMGMYVGECGYLVGFVEQAKRFDSVAEAEDYAAFVPIGKSPPWEKDDLKVMLISD